MRFLVCQPEFPAPVAGPLCIKEFAMWRALFIAVGFFCCVLGVECLVIEKAVLYDRDGGEITYGQPQLAQHREVIPPDWAPWSLMSAGAVTMLYSFTIPKRVKE